MPKKKPTKRPKPCKDEGAQQVFSPPQVTESPVFDYTPLPLLDSEAVALTKEIERHNNDISNLRARRHSLEQELENTKTDLNQVLISHASATGRLAVILATPQQPG